MGGKGPWQPWRSSRSRMVGRMRTSCTRLSTIRPGRSWTRMGLPRTILRTGGASWRDGWGRRWEDACQGTVIVRNGAACCKSFTGVRSSVMAIASITATRGLCRWRKDSRRSVHGPLRCGRERTSPTEPRNFEAILQSNRSCPLASFSILRPLQRQQRFFMPATTPVCAWSRLGLHNLADITVASCVVSGQVDVVNLMHAPGRESVLGGWKFEVTPMEGVSTIAVCAQLLRNYREETDYKRRSQSRLMGFYGRRVCLQQCCLDMVVCAQLLRNYREQTDYKRRSQSKLMGFYERRVCLQQCCFNMVVCAQLLRNYREHTDYKRRSHSKLLGFYERRVCLQQCCIFR